MLRSWKNKESSIGWKFDEWFLTELCVCLYVYRYVVSKSFNHVIVLCDYTWKI